MRLCAQRRTQRRERVQRAQGPSKGVVKGVLTGPFGAELPPHVLARSALLYRTAVLRRLRPHICELRAEGDFYAYSQRVSKFALLERRRLPRVFSKVVVDGTARGFKVATSTFVFPPALSDAQRAGWLDALRRAGYEERGVEAVAAAAARSPRRAGAGFGSPGTKVPRFASPIGVTTRRTSMSR